MAENVKAPTNNSYWNQARRPLACLAFVIPIILIYEAGVLLFGPAVPRNGIDQVLRSVLQRLGFGQYFLLPLLVCVILLAWHHTTGEKWRFRGSTLLGMLLESAIFGFVLLVLARFVFSATSDVSVPCATGTSGAGHVIAYFGAGIYEELLFRLILLPVVAFLARQCGVTRGWSLVVAVLLTSLIFSAAHYQPFNPFGDPFEWTSSAFRFSAGVYFSVLFLERGFGIAVGSHALYDVLVSLA